MKAFRAFYQTGGSQSSMIVLAVDESMVDVAVANKDRDYHIGRPNCEIVHYQEIPLSTVMVSDLSVTELLMLMGEYK